MRLPRLAWLALALLPGALAHVASCSSPPTGEVAVEAGPPPVNVPTGDAARKPDAGDAGAPPPTRKPPVLPTCLGDALTLRTAGEKAYAPVVMSRVADGGPDAAAVSVGDFLIDFGSNGSTIDLGGFATTTPPTPSFCAGDASAPGASCSFAYFDFFGPWGTVTLSTADYSVLFSSFRQSGIIGTDFLASYPFTLDYPNTRIWRGSKTGFCTDAQLLLAGFTPLPTTGFYVSDPSKLRPLSDVLKASDAEVTRRFVVPNVPTVPVTIGGVSALTQLDTGYDDRLLRHSMNINSALLTALLLKDRDMLKRSPENDLFLTTCVPGLSQKAEAYLLRDGTPVDFMQEGGQVGRHDVGNVVFVKDASAGAEKCGGIDTWTVPAAQLGASFLVDAFAVVFDPITSRVWLPR